MDDLNPPTQIATTTLIITLLDANDNTPLFVQTSYQFNINEGGYSNNHFIIQVSATDPDSTTNGNVQYRIANGNTNSVFKIDSGGLIQLNGNQILDYETTRFYNLTVEAFDQGNPPRSSSVPVNIGILNTNDGQPIFTDTIGNQITTDTVTIDETIKINSIVYRSIASDTDQDQLYFSLLDNTNSRYTIGSISGIVFTNIASYCTNTDTTETIVLLVRDRLSEVGSRNSSLTLSLTVRDINLYSPEFCPDPHRIQVPFNTGPSMGNVSKIDAFDLDECNTGFVYTLQSPSTIFTLTSEGYLSTTAAFTPNLLSYMISVTVMDQGSANSNSNTKNISIDFGQFVPIEFQIENAFISSSGYTATSALVDLNLFADAGSPHDSYITAQLMSSSISSSYMFEVAKEMATQYKLDILDTYVYSDYRYFELSIQHLTSLFDSQTSAPTAVEITITSDSITQTITDSITNENSGVKMIKRFLDNDFFNGDASRTATLDITLGTQALEQNIRTFTIVPRYTDPTIDADKSNLILRLPHRTLYPGEKFNIAVFGMAGGHLLRTFDFSVISSNSDVQFLDIDFDYSKWSIQSISSANTVVISGFNTNASVSSSDQICDINFRVLPSATSTSITFTTQIEQLSSAIEIRVPTENERKTIDRAGISETGAIYISPVSIAAVYVVADQPDIINTAPLDENNVVVRISPTVIIHNTIRDYLYQINLVNCQGTSVFVEPTDCNFVLTPNSVATAEFETISVTITSTDSSITGSGTAVAYFRIWSPQVSNLALSVADPTLSAIRNFRISPGALNQCSEQFQSTELYATVPFSFYGGTPITVQVEKIIANFLTSSTNSTHLDGTRVIGQEVGVSSISYKQTYVDVTVALQALEITSLQVLAITDLKFSPEATTPPSYPVSERQSLQVTSVLEFTRRDIEASLVAYAHLEDGHYLIVTPNDGVVFSSTNTDIVSVTGQSAMIKREGAGCFIQAEWAAPGICNIGTIATGFGYIYAQFVEPDTISAVLTATDITHTSDIGSSFIATSTDIRVNLVYAGVEIDVTDDAIYSFDDSLISLSIEDCGGNCVRFSVNNSLDSGLAKLKILFTDISSVVYMDIRVFRTNTNSLRVSLAHFPDFTGSELITVLPLNRYGGIPSYQMARVHINLMLFAGSESQSFYLNGNSGLTLTTDDSSIFGLVDSSIISPVTQGTANLIVTFSTLTSTLPITVSNMEVLVTAVTAQFIDGGNTLSGVIDTLSDRLQVDIVFADSTQIIDFFRSSSSLPNNYLSFNTNPYFDLNTTTGDTTIRGNSPNITDLIISYPNSQTTTIQLYSNLLPGPLDIDIGLTQGLPIPLSSVVPTSLPVTLNPGAPFTSISGRINYDSSHFVVNSIIINPNWPGPIFDVNYDSTPGVIEFAGSLDPSTPGSSAPILLFNIIITHIVSPITQSRVSGVIDLLIIQSQSGPPTTLAENKDFIAGYFYLGSNPANRQARSILDSQLPFYSRAKRNTECNGAYPPGDADGDCSFTVADILYTLTYILQERIGFNNAYYSQASSRQISEMDPNLDGVRDANDASYLNRVLVGLLVFVRGLNIFAPHQFSSGSECRIIIEAQLLDKNGALVSEDYNNFYGGIFSDISSFQSDIAMLKGGQPEQGFGVTIPFTSSPNYYGQFYKSQLSSNFSRIRLLPDFANDYENLAVILGIMTLNADFQTNDVRRVALFGYPNTPYLYSDRFEIQVTDTSNTLLFLKSQGFNPIQALTVNLTYDECNNANAPNFTQPFYRASVLENATIGRFIIKVTANDSDFNLNSVIAYSFTSPQIYFAIDSTTGVITTKASLNREAIAFHSFKVKATDSGVSRIFSGDVDVNITVLDVNDNPPIFEQAVYTSETFLESTTNVVVKTVSATDLDININAEIVYSLSSDCRDYFEIDSAGEITITGSLDYEYSSETSFNCTIIATDRGYPPLQGFSYFTVHLLPVNDIAPNCTKNLIVSFPETAGIGYNITIVQSIDNDVGSDHNIQIFTLIQSTPGLFKLLALNNNQVILQTNQLFVGVTTVQYTVIVNFTDNVGHYCESEIRIIVEEQPVFDFSLEPLFIGYFKDLSSYNFVTEEYERTATFFAGGTDYEQFKVVGSRAGITRETSIQKSRLSAATVTAVIRGGLDIYFDNPDIHLLARFMSSDHSTYLINPNAQLVVTGNSLNRAFSICSGEIANDGICTDSVTLDSEFFNQGVDFQVTVSITFGSVNMVIDTITIYAKPSIPASTTERLIVEYPHYNLYVSDIANINIYSYTQYSPIAFSINLQFVIGINYLTYQSEPSWLCGELVNSNSVTISCNYNDEAGLSQGVINAKTKLITVQARVTAPNPSGYTIVATSSSLTGFNTIIYSNTILTPSKYDREGYADMSNGKIYVVGNPVVKNFAITADTDIVNLFKVIQDTTPIPIPVSLVSYLENPQSIRESYQGSYTCSINPSNVLQLDTSSCGISVVDTLTIGRNPVIVTYKDFQNLLIDTVQFRVWTISGPTLLTIVLSDDYLERIEDCSSFYQDSRVEVYSTFTTTGSSTDIYYTDLSIFDFSVEHALVATYQDGYLTGISTGSSKLQIFKSGTIIGEASFTVTDNQLAIERIVAEVFTEMTIGANPSSAAIMDEIVLSAGLNIGRFEFDKQVGYVTTYAVYTDGKVRVLDDTNTISINTSMDFVIPGSSDLEVIAYGTGKGFYVQSCYAPPICPALTKCGYAEVDINIPLASSASIILSATTLAYSGTITNLIGLPSSTVFTQIGLFYGDNFVDLRNDPRTIIEFTAPNSLFSFDKENLRISAISNSENGDVSIRITFKQAPNIEEFITLSLVQISSLETIINPYPSFEPTFQISRLQRIGNTNLFQRAILSSSVSLSNNATIDVTGSTTFTITDNSNAANYDSTTRVITPTTRGNISVVANIDTLSSIPQMISIVDSSVSVVSIDSFTIPSNTLNAQLGSSGSLSLSVTMSDNTKLLDYLKDSYLVSSPPIVNLSTTDTDFIQVMQNGEVIILGNHYALVSVTATTPAAITSTDLSLNLLPADDFDIDIGSLTGIPLGPFLSDTTFDVPIRIHSKSIAIKGFDIDIVFNTDFIEPTRDTTVLAQTGVITTNNFLPPPEDNIFRLVGVLANPTSGDFDLATIKLKVRADSPIGVTVVRAFIRNFADNNNQLVVNDKNSTAGNVPVQVKSQIVRRSIQVPTDMNELNTQTHRRTVRQINSMLPCGYLGDVDDDGIFSIADAAYALDSVGQSNLTPTQTRAIDVDFNTVIDVNDVVFMIRVLANTLPFLCSVSVQPATQNLSDCLLKIRLNLQDYRGLPPHPNYTFPHLAIQSPLFQSSNVEFESSIVVTGYKSEALTTTSQRGGLWEAEPSSTPGYYDVVVNTAMSQEDIGLTVLLLTADTGYSTSRSRYIAIYKHSSTYFYSQINLDITSRRNSLVTHDDSFIGQTMGGYAPFLTFNNIYRSDLCIFSNSVKRYSVFEGFVGIIAYINAYSLYQPPLQLESHRILFPTSIVNPFGIFREQNGSFSLHATGSLERETIANYTFRIEVEGSYLSRTTETVYYNVSALYIVSLIDKNDNHPYFPAPILSISISEDITANTPIATYSALDIDSGINGEILYSIGSGDSLNQFEINDITGILRVIKGLDREDINSYTLEIAATDKGIPPLNSTIVVVITILDINDNPPVIIPPGVPLIISENQAVGTYIPTANDYFILNDIDLDINATVPHESHGILSVNDSSGNAVPTHYFVFSRATQVSMINYIIV